MGFIGLQLPYLYSLTYREFINTVNGHRKKEDMKSRERWLIARKIMYASIAVHAKKDLKETDIILFPWEKQEENISENDILNMLEKQKLAEEFFSKFDKK